MARLREPPGPRERTVAQAVRDTRTIAGAIRAAIAPTSTELELAGEDLKHMTGDLKRRQELADHLELFDRVLERAAKLYGDRPLKKKTT